MVRAREETRLSYRGWQFARQQEASCHARVLSLARSALAPSSLLAIERRDWMVCSTNWSAEHVGKSVDLRRPAATRNANGL